MTTSEILHGRIVKEYFFIDRMNEGLGPVKPKEGELFVYNYEYHGDHSTNHIVVKKNDKITKIVNVVDLSEISFEDQQKVVG